MRLTAYMSDLLDDAMEQVGKMRHEFLLPEHLLLAMLQRQSFRFAMQECDVSAVAMMKELDDWFSLQETVPDAVNCGMRYSTLFNVMIINACNTAERSGVKDVNVSHFVKAMCDLKNSEASYLLNKNLGERMTEFIDAISDFYPDMDYDSYDSLDADGRMGGDAAEGGMSEMPSDWHRLVSCVSDEVDSHNPLIGREQELDRTIQVLCRAEKNNPLHIGEPGVGKTALVYGLAKLINDGKVPDRLKDARIYSMDIGQMLAGAKYRGDFEKRVKMVMDGAAAEKMAIIYIDEIHNVVGAGTTADGGPDASNMLKPYLESGHIRFIGSTTYEEYNKRMAQSKGFVRRFQQIDIKEPTEDEAVEILSGLKDRYAEYHHVTYTDEAIEYAVRASAKHISNRCLPDKAIDLIDEAGAYLEVHHAADDEPCATKAVVQQVLVKVCRIDAAAMKEDDNDVLLKLRERVLKQIYGQDEAVEKVIDAVMMAKAGLIDDDKPMASLLFVGPTGVGKTEVARVIAKELGVELVRFDMSEYVEKHAVAKLIGSPAGYVGYDDGGLLTDAVRKTPNCVLLLDEIEKAHADIYNILLQVMDYARLTDNKGQKADFRHVILIMTSNAGAQYASQASVGFNSGMSRGKAMLAQVKKTFKPEFINRLSDTVVFNDMDETMAALILDKKLKQVSAKLAAKAVDLHVTEAAHGQLLKWGFTKEYGAREMDRVIARQLKPLLMKALLFGPLKHGGTAVVDSQDGQLVLS